MNDKTLEILDVIGTNISIMRHVGGFYGDDALRAYKNLADALEDAKNFHLLSQDMIQEYIRVLQDVHEGNMDFDDGFNRLAFINETQTDDYNVAKKKMANSLDMDGNLVELVDKQDDSKSYLNTISELMQVYQSAYDRFGEMDSVDQLCAVGNAIKDGVEQNKLSKQSAEELMKPLQEINDYFFNESAQEDAVRRFYDLLQDKLSKEDEKGSKGKDDNTQKNTENGANGNIINDGVVLGQNIGRAVKNIVKGIKEAEEKNIEKAVSKAEKEQKRDMTARDVVQSPTDDKRKLEEELQQQDKVADKQDVKKQEAQKTDKPKEEKTDKEQALENMRRLLQEYKDVYTRVGSVIDPDHPEVGETWKKLTESIGYVLDNNFVSEGVANQLREGHEYLRTNALNSERQFDGMEKLSNAMNAVKQQQRDMTARDVVQSAGDDKRKLESELQQQDKTADKQGQKKENPENTPQTNEKTIAELQRIGKMFDRQHSDESLKKMMLSLKESVKQGVIPREYFDTYKGIVDDYKQNRNADNSLLRLDNEINLQIAEMQNGDKGIKEHPQQAKNKERDMTAQDVVQSQADDKRKLQEELQQQDKVADKQGVKKQEPQKPKQEQPKNIESENDEIDKQKSFRDGVQRVLDLREHERQMKAKDVMQKPDENRKTAEDQERGDIQNSKQNKLLEGVKNVMDKTERDRKEKEQKQQKVLIKKLFGKDIVG